MPFGWLVYLLWFWFYDSQVKTALVYTTKIPNEEKNTQLSIVLLYCHRNRGCVVHPSQIMPMVKSLQQSRGLSESKAEAEL